MKQNIAIICLIKQYQKEIAKKLSEKLDMFYADVGELMEYNFINSDTIKMAGQQYFDQLESDFLKRVADYENSIFTIGLPSINKRNNLNLLKKGCLLVFLELSYKDFLKLNQHHNKNLERLDEMMYLDRTKLVEQYADVIIKPKKIDVDYVVNDMIKKIKNYYKY